MIQYSSEVEKAMEAAQATMRDHARAIGELCMSWAVIDAQIDGVLEALLECDKATVASIAASVDRIEPRIAIIRRLLVHKGLDGDWANWLNGLFDRVTKELSPLRNRYIHDQWVLLRGEIHKVDKRAAIAKPQSRQANRLIFDSSKATPTAEVDRLRVYVDTVAFALQYSTLGLDDWQTTGSPPQPIQQLIPACKPKSRMDHFPTVIVWNGVSPLPFSYVIDP